MPSIHDGVLGEIQRLPGHGSNLQSFTGMEIWPAAKQAHIAMPTKQDHVFEVWGSRSDYIWSNLQNYLSDSGTQGTLFEKHFPVTTGKNAGAKVLVWLACSGGKREDIQTGNSR